jgi:hypothetical protein
MFSHENRPLAIASADMWRSILAAKNVPGDPVTPSSRVF